MPARDEKLQVSPSNPTGDIESPYLAEDLFVGEAGPDWETRLTALEAESPFLSAFKAFEEDQSSALVPELYEEEADEWEAEDVYEEKYQYKEVADNLIADAFVANKDGQEYFTMFPQLGDLTVKKAIILTPSNFESLMDHMLASKQKNFVIDAHGDPSGLHMPLANATKISANKRSLFMLRGIEYIQTLVRVAEESRTIWERASGVEDLDKWLRIIGTIHSKPWQKMVGPPWPTETPRVSSVEAAQSLIRSRLASLVAALFPGKIADKQKQVDRLIKKMLQLQAKGLREIQFRACNIGKDSVTLYEFRKFFGANHLCAPDVRSGIGFVIPVIDRSAVNRLAKSRLTQVYTQSGGRFAILIKISGTTFKSNAAADTQQAVAEWVAAHLMANSRYRQGKLPIHFLQTQPLVFPLDKEYAAHIKCHSSFWEGAVRAKELEEQEAHEDEGYEPDRFTEQETDLQQEDVFEFDTLEGLDELKLEQDADGLTAPQEQEIEIGEETLDPDWEFAEGWTEESTEGAEYPASMGETPALRSPAHMAFAHILLESLNPATSAMAPGVVPATPSALTTPFFDASVAGTTPDSTLQQALTNLINSKSAYKNAGRNIAISLVDLSGANKPSPKYAGFNDLMNFYGGSVNKIAGLMSVYQLLAEANELLKAKPTISDDAGLESEFKTLWTQAGIAAQHHPRVSMILTVQPGSPATAAIHPELVARLRRLSHANQNGSTPIVLLKFPYIGSTMLAHGLFSPVNGGGLWTRSPYGPIVYLGQRLSLPHWSAKENPYSRTTPHNINAVSVAQFYTLAAQHRMIDEATSKAVLGHLQTGSCITVIDVTALEASGQVAAKCGIYNGWVHNTLHFKETATLREFVVVILTKNNTFRIMKDLFKDLVALIP